jgi:uncharacterized membrane protein
MKYIVLACLILLGCADNKVIDGKEYKTYGLIDKEDVRDTSIVYSVSWGNIVWGGLLCTTVAAPIYFFGFSLWEPERKK